MTASERQTWLDFYQAAEQFRDLAPWNWLYDSDIFAVQDPDTGELGYCCIMGAAGEVFALGIYLGDEGWQSYLNLANSGDAGPNEGANVALRQRLVKVEFVDREEMDKPELDHLKALGLKYRGRNQWVKAEDFLPGYLPQLISVEQARFATNILREAATTASRLKDDSKLSKRIGKELLVRTPAAKSSPLTWTDDWREFPEPIETDNALPVNVFAANALKKELKSVNGALLISLQYMPAPIADGKSRPYFPLSVVFINNSDGMILGFELFSPNDLRETFEEKFYQHLRRLKVIPKQIAVDSDFGAAMLHPFCEALGIELFYAPDIPHFEEVRDIMMMSLRGGMQF